MSTISSTQLRNLLSYNPDTGIFQWKTPPKRKSARGCAGAKDQYGYIVIRVSGKLYKAHRLAWLHYHGEWPSQNIDHINRVRDDNRIVNLRDVAQTQNMRNATFAPSKSGYVGVVWDSARGKWKAQIKVGYKNICLGRFDSKDRAIAARQKAEAAIVKQFG
jgi:hypothetical protein